MKDEVVFNEMKEKLRESIVKGTGESDKFYVFAWEAGLGKSRFVNECIREYYDKTFDTDETDFVKEANKLKRFLIVKKFKKDIYETEKELKKGVLIKMLDSIGVIGLTSENKKKYTKEQIQKCSILIISHERYITACTSELSESFGDRDTLIIDEQLQFPNIEFGRAEYNKYRAKIHLYDGQKLFDKCCEPLLNKLDEIYREGNYNNIVTYRGIKFDKQAKNDFSKWVKDNSIDNHKKDYKEILELLDTLMKENSAGFIHNNRVYLINTNLNFKKLQNNIILDASADISPIYNYKQQFKIIENRQVIDHSKSTILWSQVNTSKSKLANDSDLILKDIERKLKNIKDSEERWQQILLISHKQLVNEFKKTISKSIEADIYVPTEDNIEDIGEYAIAIDWYGNVVGKNTYRDYEICIIVGTHNLPLPVYLLQFIQYNPSGKIENLPDIMELSKGHFKIDGLEEMRKQFVATDFYQAARRIQRNQSPKALYNVYTDDENVITIFASKFRNIKPIIKDDKAFEGSKMTHTREEVALHMIQHISSECEIGESVRKQDLANKMNVSSSNISRYFKTEMFENHIELGNIEIRKKDIIKLKDFKVEI